MSKLSNDLARDHLVKPTNKQPIPSQNCVKRELSRGFKPDETLLFIYYTLHKIYVRINWGTTYFCKIIQCLIISHCTSSKLN